MESPGKIVVKVKVWFENPGGETIIGYGGYQLLKTLAETESLTLASRKLSISYGKALKIIREIEKAYGRKIVAAARGGYGGGGRTTLTREGLKLLESYSTILKATLKSVRMLGFEVGTPTF